MGNWIKLANKLWWGNRQVALLIVKYERRVKGEGSCKMKGATQVWIIFSAGEAESQIEPNSKKMYRQILFYFWNQALDHVAKYSKLSSLLDFTKQKMKEARSSQWQRRIIWKNYEIHFRLDFIIKLENFSQYFPGLGSAKA